MILLVREGVLICYDAIKYLTSVIVVVVPRCLESESGDYSMTDHLNRRSVLNDRSPEPRDQVTSGSFNSYELRAVDVETSTRVDVGRKRQPWVEVKVVLRPA